MPNCFTHRARLLPLLLLLVACPGISARAESAAPLAVVELFTSQGCSSCPPADAYLGELAQRPGVLALSFHVDYWNYIGWTDPFARKWATQRQKGYAKELNLRYVYTPQIVIDGTTEGVGSERATIGPLIRAATEDHSLRQRISIARTADGGLAIHVDRGASGTPATIWLVGFDREHVTHVLHGENEGKMLRDYQVVRSYRSLGTWRGDALDLTVPASAASGDGGVAVLLQQDGEGPIIGAALLKPSTS